MRVGQNYFPKSSFLSVEKDLALIVKKLMNNQRLMKLLYYTSKDCLSKEDLTNTQIFSMLNKQIKIVPQITIDETCPIYLIVMMDNFVPNLTNPEFKDCSISFSILCHPDNWNLGDFELRPYKIIGEIDSLLNKQKLNGIGTLEFSSATNLVLNESLMGLTISYSAIHGVDDMIP